MIVLVTGGAGLVGMALRRVLRAAGHEVVAVDITAFGRPDPDLVLLPLSDVDALERLIAERRIDAVVHGGGISGPMAERDRPALITAINVQATADLLDIARRNGIRRFLLLSSHVVYGDVGPGTITEDHGLHPSTTYAATKVAGEALVESFAREFGLSGASLRLTRVYGPYRRANCFLREILIDARAGAATTIPCDPQFPYHFIHVDDVADAVLACLTSDVLAHFAYNVTSGEVLTMPEVAAIARAVVPGAVVNLVAGVDDAPELQADFALDRIAADTGWRPRRPLATGLADYAEAFVRNPAIAAP